MKKGRPEEAGGEGDSNGPIDPDRIETHRPADSEVNGRYCGSRDARSTVTAGGKDFPLASFGAQPSSQHGIAAPSFCERSTSGQQVEQSAPTGAAREATVRRMTASFRTTGIFTRNGPGWGCK